ncbi:nicotinate-nucleotide--dimethylbenzimidazole phosphoribosyltransferase [Nonomuraea dietziae]|uniref:nicotinate-nucleotide--dimethylbenzimidazole phosphoribosyltransferase n=1 Tax=Nonomuraea dietziae TaxID=65515 RepID=UPI003CD088CE
MPSSPADHGVHAQGVSPWPQEVTLQMVANYPSRAVRREPTPSPAQSRRVGHRRRRGGRSGELPVAEGTALPQDRVRHGGPVPGAPR